MSAILFGGSFNPFHNGHLSMIEAAHRFLPEARIVLIPAGSPPHKQDQNRLPFKHRFQMLTKLADELGPWLCCSDIEARQTGPTYTINTLRRFREEQQEEALYFLIGGDSLRDLPKWFQFEDIINEVQLLIIERPGIDTDRALEYLSEFLAVEQIDALRRHTIAMAMSSLSSTQIRLALGESADLSEIAGDLPAKIFEYLTENQLLDQL
jgi:nicotinate-nucleotide adenylyltransferase